MMKLKEYAKKLLEAMFKQATSDEEVKLSTVLITNDIESTGLLIRKKGQHMGIRFNVEDYYQNYLDHCGKEDFSDTARQLIEKFREEAQDFDGVGEEVGMDIPDFSRVKDRIYLKLINTKRNSQLLKTTPHVPYLDLSAVFYLYHPIGSILIQEQIMSMWDTTPDELYEIALGNMAKQQPEKFFSVHEYLESHEDILPKEMIYDRELNPPIYALTNALNWNGASAILYPNVLETYANQYDCDWLVIPSSVHEVLLSPYSSESEIKNLCEVIREVNTLLLEPDEFLSDHPYLYKRDKKELIPVERNSDAYSQICRPCAV